MMPTKTEIGTRIQLLVWHWRTRRISNAMYSAQIALLCYYTDHMDWLHPEETADNTLRVQSVEERRLEVNRAEYAKHLLK